MSEVWKCETFILFKPLIRSKPERILLNLVTKKTSEHTNSQSVKKFPAFLWNQKGHYSVHNSPSLILVLSQTNLVHMMQSYFHNIYFNVILPSVPRSYKHSLSYRFSLPQSCMHFSSPPCVLCVPPITFSAILIPKWHFITCKNHEDPQYAIFTGLLLIPNA
jgi:hypothetical protein